MATVIEHKACPLLVNSESQPSATVPGESLTFSYFRDCLANRCAAYRSGFCERFKTVVDTLEAEEK